MRLARFTFSLVIGLLGLNDPAAGQTLLDFVTFDGIHYIRWAEEPGRALTQNDLGPEFATVGCSISDDRRNCSFGLDAAAAFMPQRAPAFLGAGTARSSYASDVSCGTHSPPTSGCASSNGTAAKVIDTGHA